MADRVFCICLRFSVPVACMFACFGPSLGTWLYQSADAGRMMRLLCPLVPFMYLDSIVDAMLKGMDEQMYSLKVNLSDSCIRIVLMIVLLPRLGIYGYLTALYISILYNALLSIGRFLRAGRLSVQWRDWLILPALSAGIACLCSRLLLYRVTVLPVRCVGMLALSTALYLLLLLFCKKGTVQSPHRPNGLIPCSAAAGGGFRSSDGRAGH
jgi:stage V sporulation protein B